MEEALDAERDEEEFIIGLRCHGCGYEIWTHVRHNTPTEIRCFREHCRTLMVFIGAKDQVVSAAPIAARLTGI